MGVIIPLFFGLLAVSFLCSVLEAIFLSITPAFVALELKENPRTGQLMEHLKQNIDRPISAILTLNTISHTAGASTIGALAHDLYGNMAITIISATLTISILFFAEIIPKMIGTIYWKELAPVAVYIIQVIIFAMYPIVWISELLGRAFRRPDEPDVTREEVIATAQIGADEGELHAKESLIIKNLLMLNNIYVSDIMTPRSVMFAIDGALTVEEIFDKYKPIRFSRIPVYEGSLDNMIGIVLRVKIFETLSNDHPDVKVKDLVTQINSVPERMTASAALDFFIKKKQHLALAVDEYGVVTGLVTLEDTVETLLGVEILDELDRVADMRQYALEQWQLRKQQIRKS
jgi:CBS domain containing-hemolysin-like protein